MQTWLLLRFVFEQNGYLNIWSRWFKAVVLFHIGNNMLSKMLKNGAKFCPSHPAEDIDPKLFSPWKFELNDKWSVLMISCVWR